MSQMARLVSLVVLTILMVFLGATFFQVVRPFLMPLFLAGVLAVLCQPVYRYFIAKTNGRRRVAAGLTTFTVLTTLLVPLLVGTCLASVQLYILGENTLRSGDWKQAVGELRTNLEIDSLVEWFLPYVSETGSSDIPQDAAPGPVSDPATKDDTQEATSQAVEQVDRLQDEIEENLRSALKEISQRTLGLAGAAAGAVPGAALDLLGALVSGLVGGLMFVIALYYFLADGPALLAATESLIPVHVEYQRELLNRFDKVVRAVVLATLLAALAQGLLTALALVTFGFGHFFIFFIIATFASLIPVAGTWLIWGPCVVLLAVDGSIMSASLLFLFGAGVIGMSDNLIRTYILHSDAKLHPLLAFVSVLGGLHMMGLWGVFIGPVVASCLHALVQIFNTELKVFSKSKTETESKPTTEDPKPSHDAGEPSKESGSNAPKTSAGKQSKKVVSNPKPTDKKRHKKNRKRSG